MPKMRKVARSTSWLLLARGTALAGAVAYALQPATVSAASLKVCSASGDACDKFVNKYIEPFILLFTASVGVLAIISYIIVAIQYSAAGDDPSAVGKAKDRAFKTTVGLIGYFFLFAMLNFLIPGGLF